MGDVHVYHEGFIPDSVYKVHVIGDDCLIAEPNFSTALTIASPRWGDCCGPFDGAQWLGADGSVDVTIDVVACLEKFKNLSTAPITARSDIEPRDPDLLITVADVTFFVGAFSGDPYPFSPSGGPPCP